MDLVLREFEYIFEDLTGVNQNENLGRYHIHAHTHIEDELIRIWVEWWSTTQVVQSNIDEQ